MKLPFDYVSRHVDALFSESQDTDDEAEIDKSCELVSAFIIACGWDETEFWRMMYGHDLPADQEELNKLN